MANQPAKKAPGCCGQVMHDVTGGSGPVRHWVCFVCEHEAPRAPATYVF